MKNSLLMMLLLTLIVPAFAADKLEVEAYAGAVSLLGYDGTQAGLRVIRPLNSWLSAGVDMATEIELTGEGSFLRAHVLLKLSKRFNRFEPYAVGSIGKDLVGQYPVAFTPDNLEKSEQWFDRQLGAGLKLGLAFHFSRFKIGAEVGGGSTGTGYEDYNIVLGMTL